MAAVRRGFIVSPRLCHWSLRESSLAISAQMSAGDRRQPGLTGLSAGDSVELVRKDSNSYG